MNTTKEKYTIYGEDIVFNSVEEAERYLLDNYPCSYSNKDNFMDLCERMIDIAD